MLRSIVSSSIAAATLCVAGAPAHALAADYPARPVRIIVPLAAGGGMDTITRALAQSIGDKWRQTVIVDNRPGAGNLVGLEILSGSAPDGYTLMMVSATTAIHPLLYGSRFDVLRDFTPVVQVTEQGYVLIIHPKLPAQNVAEFVQYLKANPAKVNYASSGIGSPIHMAGELFQIATGTVMTHIPFKGLGAAYTDLVAGRVESAFATIISALPHVKAGRLRALAVTPGKRVPAMPDMPTLREAGVDVAVVNWYGLIAPAKTASTLAASIARDVTAAMQNPEMEKRVIADGSSSVGGTPAQFAKHLRDERERWADVIKRGGIKAKVNAAAP